MSRTRAKYDADAAIVQATVDLIDGERLAELVLDQEVGVRRQPVVNQGWFDRFG